MTLVSSSQLTLNKVAGTNIYNLTIVVNKALVQIFAGICVDTKGIIEPPPTLLCK